MPKYTQEQIDRDAPELDLEHKRLVDSQLCECYSKDELCFNCQQEIEQLNIAQGID